MQTTARAAGTAGRCVRRRSRLAVLLNGPTNCQPASRFAIGTGEPDSRSRASRAVGRLRPGRRPRARGRGDMTTAPSSAVEPRAAETAPRPRRLWSAVSLRGRLRPAVDPARDRPARGGLAAARHASSGRALPALSRVLRAEPRALAGSSGRTSTGRNEVGSRSAPTPKAIASTAMVPGARRPPSTRSATRARSASAFPRTTPIPRSSSARCSAATSDASLRVRNWRSGHRRTRRASSPSTARRGHPSRW